MLFKRDNQENLGSEKRNFLTATDSELLKALGIGTGDVSINKMREATFFTCIKILSDTVSKLPLKLYKETGNGTEVASNHYLYQKLKLRPNKNMSASDFWKTVEYQRNYYGNAVIAIERMPNGKVKNLHPLDMSKVEVWYDDAQIIGKEFDVWYVYTQEIAKGKVKEYKFRSGDVLHFKGLTPNGLSGIAVKDYLSTTIENLQYGSAFTNKHFKGGLSAKGVLQYTGDISEDGMHRLRDRFEKMANGMDNVGKILPVPVGFQFASINSTMADSQFFENMNLSIRQIASAFGIKQHMLNDLAGAKFNNVTSQNEEFYRDTLLPIFTMYEQEISYKLLTNKEIELGHYFKFNVDAILRSSLKERYEAYNLGISAGFLTPNEARAKEDLPQMPNADKLIVNGTMKEIKDTDLDNDNE